MLGTTLSKLKETYIGKVCTIFTCPVNIVLKERIWREHFAVRVEDINNDGVWGKHPYNNTSSFFRLEHIVFIQEEIELDPNNPEHVKMIKEYEQLIGKPVVSDVSPHLAPKINEPENLPLAQESTLIDISKLEKLVNLS